MKHLKTKKQEDRLWHQLFTQESWKRWCNLQVAQLANFFRIGSQDWQERKWSKSTS